MVDPRRRRCWRWPPGSRARRHRPPMTAWADGARRGGCFYSLADAMIRRFFPLFFPSCFRRRRVTLTLLKMPADVTALEHAGVQRQRLEPIPAQQLAAARQLGHEIEHGTGQVRIDKLL